MLDDVTKKRINTLRQILVGKLPDPKAQVEQITNGLIYKFMNDMDEQSLSMGGKSTYFSGKFQRYSWKNLMDTKTSGVDKIKLYSDAIEQMYTNENLPELFREIFKNSFLPFKDPSTLNMFLKEINEFHYSHSEKLGDAFEYLLSFMGSQGDAGQFRTPRHIIDFITQIVNPQKNETVLDPACGTAGFLISSYKHILNQNTKKNLGDGLTASDRKKIGENLNGYDISPDMVKMSLVNMYLHKFTNPKINEYDTLSSEDRWNEYYDVILANPPFFSPKGGIMPHNRFGVKSTKAEVLFVDYINEHLKPNGRAGIIVPEGIVFQNGIAYKSLRDKLINFGLIGVLSLPVGVFQPYSGVKTSILIIDKKLAKQKKDIFFATINEDGFSLNSNRTPIEKNDLIGIKEHFLSWLENKNITSNKVLILNKEQILSHIHKSLASNSYIEQKNIISDFPIIKLGDVCEFEGGTQPPKSTFINEEKDGYIRLIQTRDYKSEKFKTYIPLKEKHRTCTSKDVMVGRYGPPVFQILRGLKGAYNVALLKCIPNTSRITTDWLFYLLKSDIVQKRIIGLSERVRQSGVRPEDLRNQKIPLPSIETQNQIVEELDGCQKIIDGCKQVIENYKPSIDIDPDWEIVDLNSLCSIITKGSTPTTYGHKFQSDGINFIKVETISQNNEIDINKMSFIDIKCHNDFKRSQLEESDILISIAGYVGISAKVNKDHIPANTNQALSIIRLKDKRFSDFVLNYLQTKKVQVSLQNIKVGVAQSNLSLEQIKNIKVPKIDIETAKKISNSLLEQNKVISLNKQLIIDINKKIDLIINNIWSN
jgi:type I restriction enzyme M protein